MNSAKIRHIQIHMATGYLYDCKFIEYLSPTQLSNKMYFKVHIRKYERNFYTNHDRMQISNATFKSLIHLHIMGSRVYSSNPKMVSYTLCNLYIFSMMELGQETQLKSLLLYGHYPTYAAVGFWIKCVLLPINPYTLDPDTPHPGSAALKPTPQQSNINSGGHLYFIHDCSALSPWSKEIGR